MIARHLFEELAGPGFGNCAEVIDELLAGHANAVVDDGQRACFDVVLDVNGQPGFVTEQLRASERLETQLVSRIGSIRDQLAKKNLRIAVERVDHQLQKLTDLGLETQRLPFGFLSHGLNSPVDH